MNVSHLMQPAFNPNFPQQPLKPNLTSTTFIPPNVVGKILEVYEKGTLKDLAKLPNNIISAEDGSFWTTWNFILWLKSQIKKTPILFTVRGEPIYSSADFGMCETNSGKRDASHPGLQPLPTGELPKYVHQHDERVLPRSVPSE